MMSPPMSPSTQEDIRQRSQSPKPKAGLQDLEVAPGGGIVAIMNGEEIKFAKPMSKKDGVRKVNGRELKDGLMANIT